MSLDISNIKIIYWSSNYDRYKMQIKKYERYKMQIKAFIIKVNDSFSVFHFYNGNIWTLSRADKVQIL